MRESVCVRARKTTPKKRGFKKGQLGQREIQFNEKVIKYLLTAFLYSTHHLKVNLIQFSLLQDVIKDSDYIRNTYGILAVKCLCFEKDWPL